MFLAAVTHKITHPRSSLPQVVCDPCSQGRAPLAYKKHEAARVCDSCYDELHAIYEHKVELD